MTERPIPARALPMLERALDPAPSAPRRPSTPRRSAPHGIPPRDTRPAPVPCLDAGLPDEPERLGGDGGTAPDRRLRGGPQSRDRRPGRDQYMRDSRGRRAEGHRADGPAHAAQGGQPRVARRADRLLGPGARPGRSPSSLSRRRHLPPAGRGARTRRPARSRVRPGTDRGDRGDDHRGPKRRRRRRPPGRDPCPCGRGGERGPRFGHRRLAPDHLRLRQDVHLLHRPVQPRTGAQPAVRRHHRRGPRTRVGRLFRGHPPRPERQFLRP